VKLLLGATLRGLEAPAGGHAVFVSAAWPMQDFQNLPASSWPSPEAESPAL